MIRLRHFLPALMPVMTMLSTQAVAEEGKAYIALKGGLMSPFDLEYIRPITGNSVTTEYDQGYSVSAAVGTRAGEHGRMELEGMYQYAKVDKNQVSGFGSAGSQGESSIAALMVNGYYDFPLNIPLKPYLGAGLGGAYVKYDGHRTSSVGLISDQQVALGYQGMAGFGYSLTDKIDMNLEYRYFSTAGIEVEMNQDDVDFSSQSVLLGLAYHF